MRQPLHAGDSARALGREEAEDARARAQLDDVRALGDELVDRLLERAHTQRIGEHLPVVVERDELPEQGVFIHAVQCGHLRETTREDDGEGIGERNSGFHQTSPRPSQAMRQA